MHRLTRFAVPLLGPTLLWLAGCGDVETSPSPCLETPPVCVARSVSCGAPSDVPPACSMRSHEWSCPAGSDLYEYEPAPAAVCLPFHDASSPVHMLGGSLVRVPIDDGRCLWVGESVTDSTGAVVPDVGFVADTSEPFGACPAHATFAGGSLASAVTITGTDDDPTLHVQIDGGFLFHAQTRVLYRLFRSDPSAEFGVTELGGGLGAWDAASQRIVVPGPDALTFGTEVNLGDAHLVVGDDVFIWGCHAPETLLTEPCSLAKMSSTGIDYLDTSGAWIADASVADTATVFSGGPWIASVAKQEDGTLQHIYAVGFGTTLESDTARDAAGPWTAGGTVARCDLPADDPGAFCAGPVVHDELADPKAQGPRVVSYAVGTTNVDSPSKLPDAYWTRLARVQP